MHGELSTKPTGGRHFQMFGGTHSFSPKTPAKIRIKAKYGTEQLMTN